MLLCLSSGFTPRYKEDVLRSISMPVGSLLRFRYELGLISESLKQPIANNAILGEQVCIAYLDRSDQTRRPAIVPCRQAILRKSDTPGDFCVLDFELGDFWVAPDPQAFNREIRAMCGNLPDWSQTLLKGDFCCKVGSVPNSLKTTSKILDWQRLVITLKEHTDFAGETFFYFVFGMYSIGNNGRKVQQEMGFYTLRSNTTYEIRLVQYSPGETNQAVAVKEIDWMIADCDATTVSFITNKKLAVDSGYDEKFFRFRTGNTVSRIDSMISLFRQLKVSDMPKSSDGIWDFDLGIRIEPRIWTPIWQGLVLGVFIACQGLAPILANASITEKVMPSVVVVMAGLFAGFVASFGLRKP